MSAYYKPNPQGFQDLANSPEMHDLLDHVAGKAKVFAEALAEDFRRTGEYADSFAVVPLTVIWEGRFGGPRAASRLENSSSHAAAVEWGNSHDQNPHRVLSRTLDALKAL